MFRHPLDILTSEISESLRDYLGDEDTKIVQSVLDERDYVATIDEEDYFVIKYLQEEESTDSFIVLSQSQIDKGLTNAKKLKDLLPKRMVMVSHRLDIGLDKIRQQDDVQREREYVDGLILDLFKPRDLLKMFFLSLFK